MPNLGELGSACAPDDARAATLDPSFRVLFAAAGEGVALVDHDGRIRDANPNFCALAGEARAALRARAIVDLIGEEAGGGGTHHVYARGERIPVVITTRPMPAPPDGPGGVLWLIDDKRPAQAAAARLADAEARAEQLSRNSPGIVFQRVMKPDGTLSYDFIGGATDEIYGVDAAEMMADPACLIDCFDGDDRAAWVEATVRSAEEMKPFELDLEIVNRRRERRWVRSHSKPRHGPEGSVIWDGVVLDVTELKRTERALKRREAELAVATRSARIGAFEHDLRTREIRWAPETEDLFGADPAVCAPDLSAFLRLVHPDDWNTILDAHRRAVDLGDGWDIEYRVVRPDGGIRHLRSKAEIAVHRDLPARAIGCVQDITDHKETERALNRVIERFTLATQATNDGLWDWHVASGKTWYSPSACALLDLNAEGSVGTIDDWKARIHADDRSRVLAALRDHLDSGALFDVEYRERSETRVRWLHSTGMARRDPTGRPVRMFGSHRDITERKESEEKFRVLFDHSTDALLVLDEVGIVDCNPATQWMLGLADKARIVGHHPADLSPDAQADDRLSRSAYRDMERLAQEKGHHRFEWTLRSDDGMMIPVEITLTPARLSGRPVMLAVWHDIAAQKAFEETLRDATEKAVLANRAKSEFLANMSHEIRTPLNGVIGMIEVLLSSDLTETQRAHAGLVKESADGLLQIINDVLDLSKLEAGRLELDPVDFDLRVLLESVLKLLRPRASQQGNVLRLKIASDVCPDVNGDQTRIRQILFNLVGNAIKFTDHGRVTVRVDRMAREDDRVVLRTAIEDTGIGIEPAARDALFEKFTQADSSITRRYGGTGLGLSICRELTRLLGGDLGVDSVPGEGSTFWFTVPLGPSSRPLPKVLSAPGTAPGAAAAGAEDPGAEDVLSSRRLRVLVADDNHINRRVAETLLKIAGIEAEAVTNGAEAVAAARAKRYDLILMDVQMPEVDGVEATRRIRALPKEAASVPIIALTARAMEGDRETYLAAGMDDFIAKPIDRTAFFRTIAAWTERAAEVPAA